MTVDCSIGIQGYVVNYFFLTAQSIDQFTPPDTTQLDCRGESRIGRCKLAITSQSVETIR